MQRVRGSERRDSGDYWWVHRSFFILPLEENYSKSIKYILKKNIIIDAVLLIYIEFILSENL